MKSLRWIVALLLAAACAVAQAGETAYTVRATALKAKPYTDADTLATLPEQSAVEILGRRGSWNQVKAGGTTGWVKMLSLRVASGQRKSGDSGLKALFGMAATGSSGSTMTTGVRGLSEEKLHNPHPNPEALKQLRTFAVSGAEAQQFAAAGKLVPAHVDYLPAPAK